VSTHVVIPDTQVTPSVRRDHLTWIGRYIADLRPDVVVHLGDHWDFESLSVYDRGKLQFEGRRLRADIDAGNAGLAELTAPIHDVQETARRGNRRIWKPRLVMLRGNHEHRLSRAVEEDPKLEGFLDYSQLNDTSLGWEVHDFLDPVEIDGVVYAHYFYNPLTGKPWGGTVATMLKNIGHTFTMGHRQTFDVSVRYVGNRQIRGIVAGACYLHDEDYKGPQGNHHWRGILVKHEVRDGQYDLMEVSLDYLCRKYEGVSLVDYLEET